MSVKIATYLSSLAMLLAASLLISPAINAVGASTADSAEVSQLLSEAKSHAVELNHDASEMESFTRSNLSWESHAGQIEKIKRHTNDLGQVVQKLNDARETASRWQQEAIDRVNPVLKELASNIESTIEHLRQNQSRLHTPVYKDYVRANYDLATEAAAIVGDFVEYGKTKAKFEKLGQSLEVSQR